MVSGLPRVPETPAWCESWGASPSSVTATGSEETGCAAVSDFFFRLFFDSFFFEPFLRDDFFFFEDFFVVDFEEESACGGVPVSVWATALSAKQKHAATTANSLRRCMRSPRKTFVRNATTARTSVNQSTSRLRCR